MEWFSKYPSSYWQSLDNCKKFLDEVAEKLNIKNPRDWGKVTGQLISDLGGTSLLSNYYDNSLFSCLQSIYAGNNT